jgi:glycosyltransferase involved in cell wall biosynthesis
MALGVPVIASGYSGNLDFMNAENSLLVPVRRITTDRPYGPYPAGTVWGEPDLQVAAEQMVSLLARWSRKTLGKKGQESVRRQLSPQRVGELVKNLLGGTSSQQLIQQYESGIPGQ